MANVPGLVTDPSKIKGGFVHVPVGGSKIPAYLAQPNDNDSHPGIVVIMEAFGLADHICDIARRFANIGYNAICPDLYWRDGNPTDVADFATVLPVMFGLKDSQAVGDLEASADFLRGLKGATGKVGAIGFCSGGRHTLLFACSSKKVDAAVDCWGGFVHRATPDAETTPSRPTKVLDLMGNLGCPLFGVFGAEDQNPPVEIAEEMKKRGAGKDVTTKVYPNAPHAFLADYRPTYRESPAHELWNDATVFFAKHLR